MDVDRPAGMQWIAGATFAMGSEDFYPEERPVHAVQVDGFWMDEHPVTVEAFARFVAATGHVTLAERPPDPTLYPGADPALLVPGSLVFTPTAGPVPLDDYRHWWRWVPGASWRLPVRRSRYDGRVSRSPAASRSTAASGSHSQSGRLPAS